ELWIQPNQSANDAIHWMFVGLSIVVILLGALVIIRYKIDKNALSDRINSGKQNASDEGDAETAGLNSESPV
ncbi:MAG: MFS transporter, partial [Clostridiales bacterium]|nr:MFS transporter [Clostridiales bacterium]